MSLRKLGAGMFMFHATMVNVATMFGVIDRLIDYYFVLCEIDYILFFERAMIFICLF